jgi:hypothetical protein
LKRNCYLPVRIDAMLNLIPGGGRIKQYIYRMILGILCIPIGMVVLFYNENKAIHHSPIFQGYDSDLIYWGGRFFGFLILFFCFSRIFSSIKLFMSKIPLNYNEIRTLIMLQAFLFASITSLVIISLCRIYYQPLVGLILCGVAIALTFVLLIRWQRKKKQKSQVSSVKPRQAKDV